MTVLEFDDEGVEVLYQGTEFRLERSLIEDAISKPYYDVTDHEVLQIVAKQPDLRGEPRRIGDILERS